MNGKVWLIGAGPGDHGLLTLRGKDVLEQAEVVVYDALVGQGILCMMPDNAERISVGKRSGDHTLPQDEINALLLTKAMQGKRVVRLKGGDPFLFGRGGEELELLIEHDIPYEIVPGVTSAFAVPAYNGIPVTHRDICSSVHIITGHRKKGRVLSLDFKALCAMHGTLVFLMGIAALPDICGGLLDAGMDPKTPAAVLERGTTAAQKRVIGTVGSLTSLCTKQKVQTPAIIVVGDVCALSERFAWYEKLPLFGVKAVVTRPKERSSALSSMLRQKGAEVIELPAIDTKPLVGNTRLDDAITSLLKKKYDWLVFTSPAGVKTFFSRLMQTGDCRMLNGVQIAVIGQGTQKELMNYGLKADFIPSVYDGQTLGRELAEKTQAGARMLIPRAAAGNQELVEELRRVENVTIDDIPIYETRYKEMGILDLKTLLESGDMIFTMFTSASTVKGFARIAAGLDMTRVKAVCIGKQTQAEAARFGMNTWTAERATLEALTECLQNAAYELRNKEREAMV
ncbi:MAG: uroporphyrinogen-III C-methyltransferase [Clostridia bacterium]|nr:uroporphyrinogen-III C-methyltransferase [Clostridia bacterium]